MKSIFCSDREKNHKKRMPVEFCRKAVPESTRNKYERSGSPQHGIFMRKLVSVPSPDPLLRAMQKAAGLPASLSRNISRFDCTLFPGTIPS